jgi:hypothetical protein
MFHRLLPRLSPWHIFLRPSSLISLTYSPSRPNSSNVRITRRRNIFRQLSANVLTVPIQIGKPNITRPNHLNRNSSLRRHLKTSEYILVQAKAKGEEADQE